MLLKSASKQPQAPHGADRLRHVVDATARGPKPADALRVAAAARPADGRTARRIAQREGVGQRRPRRQQHARRAPLMRHRARRILHRRDGARRDRVGERASWMRQSARAARAPSTPARGSSPRRSWPPRRTNARARTRRRRGRRVARRRRKRRLGSPHEVERAPKRRHGPAFRSAGGLTDYGVGEHAGDARQMATPPPHARARAAEAGARPGSARHRIFHAGRGAGRLVAAAAADRRRSSRRRSAARARARACRGRGGRATRHARSRNARRRRSVLSPAAATARRTARGARPCAQRDERALGRVDSGGEPARQRARRCAREVRARRGVASARRAAARRWRMSLADRSRRADDSRERLRFITPRPPRLPSENSGEDSPAPRSASP